MRTRRWFFVLLVVVGAAAFGRGLVPLLLRAQGLSVGGYQLVSRRRIYREIQDHCGGCPIERQYGVDVRPAEVVQSGLRCCLVHRQ